ncbi:MAG: hypothetical protein H6537_09010 [Bacteroidales bacterium]|nr:hypothetical protein [Bacteroidales bacterium]HRX31386.1 hypothetical protein [Tenuifilaceae bacterium]
MKLKTWSLVILCLVPFWAVSQDFEVAPVKMFFDAEPATSQTKTISVTNHSARRVSYSVGISDFLPTSEGNIQSLPPNSTKRSCANWINVNPSFFELNPGDNIEVQVNMLVPGEEYGSTWCMLYVQPTKEQTTWSADKVLSTGITVTGRIGVQVFQSPKSNQNYSIKISNLKEVTAVSDTLRRFTATIENLGDKVTTCKTFLLASNMQTAEEKQFATQDIVVFPKLSRNIELTMTNDLPTGTYALAAIVDYGPKFPLEGAQIVINVGNATTPIPVQSSKDSTTIEEKQE